MPVLLHCGQCPVSEGEAGKIWSAVIEHMNFPDETVGVQCVDKEEIKRINKEYRGKNRATNVLTFSYGDGQHDISLCLEVAREEAGQQGISLKSYVALLLVHAFLHAAGLDHEESKEAAARMSLAEKDILKQLGFDALSL